MGRFNDKHKVDALIGAPPGYLKADEPAALNQIMKDCRDGSVVLLDEADKAHDDVWEKAFLDPFETGTLVDNQNNFI
jgi:ATP-dependent Clp protease ATP-binding subunit ClpB